MTKRDRSPHEISASKAAVATASAQDAIVVDGRPVTAGNARRFVQARRSHAKATRVTEGSGRNRSVYVRVRDHDPAGGASWCQATARTAGEAWLRCAQQMVKHDARVAAEGRALEAAVAALTEARTPDALQVAALRYAAVRVQQHEGLGHHRTRTGQTLVEMADAMSVRRG